MKFLSYRSARHPEGVVGLLDAAESTVKPLIFPNRRPVTSLQHLIAQWDLSSDKLLPGPQEHVADIEILAPLRGRDILCVGKNYKEHAKEFNDSGYDSSDRNEQPDFPVIFTKRATSIIGPNTPIYPHPKVTDTLDYEGELGIIVGKGGIGIRKENAWDHVWGAVIINDFTARERQRDHKQFYIGKSLDTFCPMGPYAVHASALDWKNMELVTKVNGETRQQQKTSDLIFDIPTLIETCSMGITLQPGDVIATGTPAGVCLSSGKFLKSGDRIDISITGLGVLSNVVGKADSTPPKVLLDEPFLYTSSLDPDSKLAELPSGRLHVEVSGNPSGSTVIFIHGLGGNSTNYIPLIHAARLQDSHNVVTFDFEGHGLSPLTGEGLTVDGIVLSVKEVLEHVGAERAVVVGHSMGGLVATCFAATYPQAVTKLILYGPVKQFAEAGFKALSARAQTVRDKGMPAVAESIARAGTSNETQATRSLAFGAVYSSLLFSPVEGYAQACLALATAVEPAYERISAPTILIAGAEDKTSPTATIDYLHTRISGSNVVTLQNVGHWHLLEDVEASARALVEFL